MEMIYCSFGGKYWELGQKFWSCLKTARKYKGTGKRGGHGKIGSDSRGKTCFLVFDNFYRTGGKFLTPYAYKHAYPVISHERREMLSCPYWFYKSCPNDDVFSHQFDDDMG